MKSISGKIWHQVQEYKARGMVISAVNTKVSDQVWSQFRKIFYNQALLSIKKKLK